MRYTDSEPDAASYSREYIKMEIDTRTSPYTYPREAVSRGGLLPNFVLVAPFLETFSLRSDRKIR
jgi:hypothetical protein